MLVTKTQDKDKEAYNRNFNISFLGEMLSWLEDHFDFDYKGVKLSVQKEKELSEQWGATLKVGRLPIRDNGEPYEEEIKQWRDTSICTLYCKNRQLHSGRYQIVFKLEEDGVLWIHFSTQQDSQSKRYDAKIEFSLLEQARLRAPVDSVQSTRLLDRADEGNVLMTAESLARATALGVYRAAGMLSLISQLLLLTDKSVSQCEGLTELLTELHRLMLMDA